MFGCCTVCKASNDPPSRAGTGLSSKDRSLSTTRGVTPVHLNGGNIGLGLLAASPTKTKEDLLAGVKEKLPEKELEPPNTTRTDGGKRRKSSTVSTSNTQQVAPIQQAHAADAAAGVLPATATPSKRQEEDELMPLGLKRGRSGNRSGHLLQKRKSIAAMDDYLGGDGTQPGALSSATQATSSSSGPVPVTKDNIHTDLRVVRGTHWTWGDEDGGAGKTGVIFAVDLKAGTAQVRWQASGHVYSHYRFSYEAQDLAVAPDPGNGKRGSTLHDTMRRFRRNSQAFFADPSQTVIIYDWDDTLFPTTYVRDDLQLSWREPLANQGLDAHDVKEIGGNLNACAKNVHDLLRMSVKFGKVLIVTLARSPWVSESCKNFFPEIGKLIDELKIPIVYAQEGHQVDYNKLDMASNQEVERYWSMVKGKAIAREISIFYSQYTGQSWKNVISIGDSDFERLGTKAATSEYLSKMGVHVENLEKDSQQQGGSRWTKPFRALARGNSVNSTSTAASMITAEKEVDGHVFKVRTKTFKMVDQPTVEELTVEVAMLQKWISPMVSLDEGFDVNLNDLDDPTAIRRIEQTFMSKQKR